MLSWIGLIVGLGYAIGHPAVQVAKAISRYGLLATIALVAIALAIAVLRARRGRRPPDHTDATLGEATPTSQSEARRQPSHATPESAAIRSADRSGQSGNVSRPAFMPRRNLEATHRETPFARKQTPAFALSDHGSPLAEQTLIGSTRAMRVRQAPSSFSPRLPIQLPKTVRWGGPGPPTVRKPSPLQDICVEADARTRTGDPFITSEVLYQLSYVGDGLWTVDAAQATRRHAGPRGRDPARRARPRAGLARRSPAPPRPA